MQDEEMVKSGTLDQWFKAQAENKTEETPAKTEETTEEKKTEEPIKQEEPAKEELVKTEETEEKINSLFEKIKEEPKSEPETKALSEDVQKKLDELEAYRQQLETIKNNPLVKALELGKDLKEVAKKIVGNDVGQLSIEKLLEAKIKNEFALEGEELEDAVAEEMQSLEGKSRLELARIHKDLREEFSRTNSGDDIMRELLEYEAQVKANQLTPEKIAENEKAIKEQDLAQIESASAKLVDGDLYGVKLTKEYVEKVKQNYNMNEIAPYVDAKGNLDAQKFMVDKFILDNWQKIAENAFEMGKKGTLKNFANPDKSSRGSSPESQKPDAFKENFKGLGMNMNQKVINID
jgi:hypothetical protein